MTKKKRLGRPKRRGGRPRKDGRAISPKRISKAIGRLEALPGWVVDLGRLMLVQRVTRMDELSYFTGRKPAEIRAAVVRLRAAGIRVAVDGVSVKSIIPGCVSPNRIGSPVDTLLDAEPAEVARWIIEDPTAGHRQVAKLKRRRRNRETGLWEWPDGEPTPEERELARQERSKRQSAVIARTGTLAGRKVTQVGGKPIEPGGIVGGQTT